MPILLIQLYTLTKQLLLMNRTCRQQLQSQPSASKIPASIKLVEEGEIDVENILAGLEHKLFCQNVIRGVVA